MYSFDNGALVLSDKAHLYNRFISPLYIAFTTELYENNLHVTQLSQATRVGAVESATAVLITDVSVPTILNSIDVLIYFK